MLNPTQRLFFDVNGYVLVKRAFHASECDRFIAIADRMKADIQSNPGRRDEKWGMVLFGTAWYDPHLLDTAMGSRLRPMAEQVLGGEARLEENQILIFYRNEKAGPVPPSGLPKEGWHRGINPNYGSFEADGHYHCLLPKALVYLTEQGPGTGTWVFPGSHRITTKSRDLAPLLDESLVRQVPAERGDVLLLGETLVHASPSIPLAKDRYLMVFAYCAPFMKPWSTDVDPPEDIAHRLTKEQRRFVYGDGRYDFRPA